MGDLTKNINRSELACSCGCGFDSIDIEVIIAVQQCCDHFAKKLRKDRVVLDITSAARCYEYNRKPLSEGGPGSNDNSQHPKARAIDFKIRGVVPAEVYAYLVSMYDGRFGIGRYDSFTHIDSRTGGSARWG